MDVLEIIRCALIGLLGLFVSALVRVVLIPLLVGVVVKRRIKRMGNRIYEIKEEQKAFEAEAEAYMERGEFIFASYGDGEYCVVTSKRVLLKREKIIDIPFSSMKKAKFDRYSSRIVIYLKKKDQYRKRKYYIQYMFAAGDFSYVREQILLYANR